jgi:hypothetical protein
MSLLAPPAASYPDIATGFKAVQDHAKQHGYAFVQRVRGWTPDVVWVLRAHTLG